MADHLLRGIPADLWKALKVQAATEGVTLKALVVRYLAAGLLQRGTE